jgi:drug/metabolite transporter (DMT)-like permease
MYRLLIVLLLFLPLFIKDRKKFHALPWKTVGLACLSGLFLALHFLLGVYALRFTTIASNTILITLEPLIVFIGSIFIFGDKLNLRAAASMIIAVTGALMMAFTDFNHIDATAPNLLLGDFLTILGTISISIYMILGQKLTTRMHATVYNFYVFAFAGLVLFCINLLSDQTFIDYPISQWGYLILLAVVPTIFGLFLQNWLLQYVSAVKLSITILGVPIGSNILAYFFYGKIPSLLQIVACLITLVGVWLFLKQKDKTPEPISTTETPLEKT